MAVLDWQLPDVSLGPVRDVILGPSPHLLNQKLWRGGGGQSWDSDGSSSMRTTALTSLKYLRCLDYVNILQSSRPRRNTRVTKNVTQEKDLHHPLESGKMAGVCWSRPQSSFSKAHSSGLGTTKPSAQCWLSWGKTPGGISFQKGVLWGYMQRSSKSSEERGPHQRALQNGLSQHTGGGGEREAGHH